ncbi:MAG: BMP family protein [Spirochaetales bacterium]|nr:BMP family protein [Spirochaetales bacterium]MBQ7508735.1 BMP family protein [Spirochaetales bacterium]
MKKLIIFALLAMLATGMVFANAAAETAQAGQGTIKVALIVENTVDDKGWCQAMHDGIVQAMAEMPANTIAQYTAVENTVPADAKAAVSTYVNLGYNIIILHGSQFRSVVEEVSKDYPNVMFAFGTTTDIIGSNVFSYMPQSEETGFLSGIVAGLTTKANKVALVGPIDGGDSARYNRGFVLGVQSVNKDAKISVTHIGSFGDVVKSNEAAKLFIEAGNDVLTGSSQQALGALRAVAEYKDKDIWWVGQDTAQIALDEGYKCIAASSYNYKAVLIGLVDAFKAGKLGGEVIPMNFSNGGFVWEWNEAKCAEKITPEIRKAVEDKLAQFKAQPNLVANYSEVDYTKL